MKRIGDGENTLECPTQQRCQISEAVDARRARALKRRLVGAGENPGFVGDARSVGAERNVVAAHFQDAHILAFFLRDDVAENAALFALEVVASSAQFVENTAWDEGGGGELRSWMREFLSGAFAVIFEDADVLEAAVALQVLNAQRGQAEKLFHLDVARVPDVAVMARILYQNFVGADRSHTVIEAFAAASRIAFDVVERLGMDYGAR